MSSPTLNAPFVMVTGGKGGVGKTTVAANLGVGLAREGRKVLLVDLDLGLSNLDVVLGLTVPARLDAARLDAIARGEISMESCIVQGPGGVDVLVAANGDESMASLGDARREQLIAMIAEVSSGYDVVIGDSAAGVGADVLGFASIADRVLVVTTPDLAALTDAYGLIKALDLFGSRTATDIPTPEIVVNHASGIEEGKAIARKLRAICERFLARSPRQAGWLPRSVAVERSATLQTPFVLRPKRALENVCMGQIASRLQRLTRPIEAPSCVSTGTPALAGKIF